MSESRIRGSDGGIRFSKEEPEVFSMAEDIMKNVNQVVIRSREAAEKQMEEQEDPENYAEEQVAVAVNATTTTGEEVIKNEIRELLSDEEKIEGWDKAVRVGHSPDTEYEQEAVSGAEIRTEVTTGGQDVAYVRTNVSEGRPNAVSQANSENLPSGHRNSSYSRIRSEDHSIRFSDDHMKNFVSSSAEEMRVRKTSESAIIGSGKSSAGAAGTTGSSAGAAGMAGSAGATGASASAAGKSAASGSAASASAGAGAVAAETAGESAAAGGWIAWLIIVIIIFIMIMIANIAGAMLTNSYFDDGHPVHEVITEINREYQRRINEMRNEFDYDTVTVNGAHASWKDVLSLYFSGQAENSDSFMSYGYVDDEGVEYIKSLFWAMTNIESDITRKTVRELVQIEEDEYGRPQFELQNVTKNDLTITITSRTVDEMAEEMMLNEEELAMLMEFLSEENDELWSMIVHGSAFSDSEIVDIAYAQLGNAGGETYWRWYGFSSHVEWCACFVSWCANECGYIESGTIPKYSSCAVGVQWFKDHGKWLDASEEPEPGMIIFFDWNHPDGQSGPQNGVADHTGIVERVEDNIVYTIEGNAWDVVMENHYPVGWYEILGYGIVK